MNNKNINNANKHLIFGTNAFTKGAFYRDMKLQRSEDPSANKLGIIIALQKTSLFEKLWYPTFIIAGILCLIFIKPFSFELCFAVLSMWLYMLANNLIARGKIYGLIISIISASLYVVVSFFAKVYGEVIINLLLYIPLDALAIINFKRNINKETEKIEVNKLNLKKWGIVILSTTTITLLVFAILFFIPGQAFPLLNALSISLFLMGIFVRNFRYMEFWYFDLLGNIATITLWILVSSTTPNTLFGLPSAISSIAVLLNNIYGIYYWQKLYKINKVDGGVYIKRKVKIKKVIKLRRRYNKALLWNKNLENNKIQKGKLENE